MKKSEMMRNWKEVSGLKSEFTKALGDRFPHICYTDEKLLSEIKTTLTGLTKKISAVKDGKPEVEPKAEKKSLLRGGVERMARMIEPEQEEITGITSLPPRVDPGEAYRPAKLSPKK